jgi:hypothetical protein
VPSQLQAACQHALCIVPPSPVLQTVLSCPHAQAVPQFAILGQRENCPRDCRAVSRGGQQSIHLVLKYFRQLLKSTGDDGLSHGHVLKQLDGRTEEPGTVRHVDVR